MKELHKIFIKMKFYLLPAILLDFSQFYKLVSKVSHTHVITYCLQ